MLTLTAMHVMNETTDPFFTSLQAGAYDKVRPKGTPCDEAFPCGLGGLSKGARIAIAVTVTVVGLVLVGLLLWCIRSQFARKKRF
jgi:endoglucanase